MPPKGKKGAKLSLREFQDSLAPPSSNIAGAKPKAAQVSTTVAKSEKPTTPPESGLAPHPAALKAAQAAPAVDEKENLCHICTDPISWYAVGECNHRICHLCSLRLRALLKDQSCPLCKTTLPKVIYTGDEEKPFNNYDIDSMTRVDKRLAIHFESQQIYEDVMILLRFNCPDASCDVACPEGWPELRRHVQATHGKYLCDLCTRHQRLFTHEHALYTATELDRHFKVGDETDKSFKGHPSCGFCKTHFYGDDELYEHCRKEHEQCFLCTRAGVRHQYYVNYNALEMHFRGDHFACLEPECLEKKFQVFISDIDLKAHDMEVHPHKRTSRGKGEKIEVNFQVTGGPSNGRRRNADRLPAQSPAPTPSDANGRAVDDRARREPDPSLFRGSNGREARAAALREEEFPPPAPIPGASTSKAPIAPTPMRQTQSPKIKNRRPNVMNVEEFPTPQAAARESKTSKPASTQDGDVVSKLQILFESNEETFTEFKQFATSFRQGVIDANEFFVKFLSLALEGAATELDKKNTELTVFNIWTRMADTVPDEGQDASARWNPNTRTKGKREQMLEALNNFRAKKSQQRNEPPIPTSSSSSYARPYTSDIPSSSSSSASARVLVIKSKASKQKIHAGTSWNAASAGRGYVAPSIVASSEGSSTTTLTPPTPAAPVAPVLSIVNKKLPTGSAEFPGLPKPAMPKVDRLKKDGPSAWSEGGSDGPSQNSTDSQQRSNQNQKKNKKGKAVLLHFG